MRTSRHLSRVRWMFNNTFAARAREHLFLSYRNPRNPSSRRASWTHTLAPKPAEAAEAAMADEDKPAEAPPAVKTAKQISDHNDSYVISIYEPLPADAIALIDWEMGGGGGGEVGGGEDKGGGGEEGGGGDKGGVEDRREGFGEERWEYCWGGMSEVDGEEGERGEGESDGENDGEGEVDYPDDPDEDALLDDDALSNHDERFGGEGISIHDEVSDYDELAIHDEPPPPDGSSHSKTGYRMQRSSTREQSDAELAWEVAYGYLRNLPGPYSCEDSSAAMVRSPGTAVAASEITSAPVQEHASDGDGWRGEGAEKTERGVQQPRPTTSGPNLPIPASRGDAGKVEVGDRESAVAGRMVGRSQRSPEAEDESSEETAERAGSEVQQRKVAGRLKTKGDLRRAMSTMDSDVSKFESWRAAMLPPSEATVSDTPTSDALCLSRMTKELESIRSSMMRELEKIRGTKGKGLLSVRPPKASWIARFASAPFWEDSDPSPKRIRFGPESGQWSIVEPKYIKLAMQFYEKYSVADCPFGRSSRSRKVVAGIWERAETVDLGQPAQQPVKSLPRHQWPKPVQQPVEPPPWQLFLESMKRPVQNIIEDPIRQAVPQPDIEHEQQSVQQAVQQLSRLSVQDSINESLGKPVQQPVHVPPKESVKEPVQLSIPQTVKTPEGSSVETQSVRSAETRDQQQTGEPVKKPKIRLLLGRKPQQEHPGEPPKQHSPKSPFRKNPAQRRIERSKRLNKDSANSPSSEAAPSQRITHSGLAVSDITVVCDFQPTTPDISRLLPPQTSNAVMAKSKIVKLKLPATSPAPDTALTTALQSLDLGEGDERPLQSSPSRSAS